MVTIFGLGFVGLTTAVGLAEKGYQVYGVDINNQRKETIASGRLPFLEPGLDKGLIRNLNKNFFVCEDLAKAISSSEYVFYCVGTPCGDNGEADLGYLFKAIDQTLEVINDNKFRVLIIKSTIPPSTTEEKIVPYLVSKGYQVGEHLGIANNPEFLREGYCWDDFMNPDRIVVGVNDEKSKQMLESLYMPFKAPFFAVNHNTGEFIKYLSNTILATLISYANEMSIVAQMIGHIDTAKAFKILHMDKRWEDCKMTSYLYPGCGYGGYCLSKDTNAIYALAKSKGFEPKILENVIKVNNNMPDIIADRVAKVADKTDNIGILGLSFKPGSDDVRDTPAAKIINKLFEKGFCNITGYDPVAIEEFKKYYSKIDMDYTIQLDNLIETSDVLVIVTAWSEFKGINLKTNKPIIDGRFML